MLVVVHTKNVCCKNITEKKRDLVRQTTNRLSQNSEHNRNHELKESLLSINM